MMKEEKSFKKLRIWQISSRWENTEDVFILNSILCCSILSSGVQSGEGGMEAGAKGQKRKVEF